MITAALWALVDALRPAHKAAVIEQLSSITSFLAQNAFNALDRRAVLSAVLQYFPGLFQWAEWSCAWHTNLAFGNHIIASHPFGSLLYSTAIHSIVCKLAA